MPIVTYLHLLLCVQNQSNLKEQGNFLIKQKQIEQEKGAFFQI